MPHPDSLSGIGTSRTTTPGSSDIQVMACSVPGLPRLAIRSRRRSGICRLRHQGVMGLLGSSPPRTQACAAPSCLHSLCLTEKTGELSLGHRSQPVRLCGILLSCSSILSLNTLGSPRDIADISLKGAMWPQSSALFRRSRHLLLARSERICLTASSTFISL
jgi:hypothetical protein